MSKRLSRKWSLATVTLAAALAITTQTPVWSADNTATGDIAGVTADLTNSNVFTLNATVLALVKAAFLNSDGTALTSGDSVPAGTLVDFLIYIDNDTAVTVDDVRALDPLTGFTYQAGSIKVDNAVNTGGSEAAIYASVILTPALLDAVDGADEAGYTSGTTTISVGSGAGNAQLDIAGDKVWALVFTASVD